MSYKPCYVENDTRRPQKILYIFPRGLIKVIKETHSLGYMRSEFSFVLSLGGIAFIIYLFVVLNEGFLGARAVPD